MHMVQSCPPQLPISNGPVVELSKAKQAIQKVVSKATRAISKTTKATKYKLGTNSYSPYTFKNQSSGEWTGFGVDMARMMSSPTNGDRASLKRI